MDWHNPEGGDAFAVPRLWDISLPDLSALVDRQTLFRGVDFEIPSAKLENLQAPSNSTGDHLPLIDLDNYSFGDLSTLDDTAEGTASTTSLDELPSSLPKTQDTRDDLWRIADDFGPISNDIKLQTWEAFFNPVHEEPRPAFLSEAGPAAFDAALEIAVEALKDGTLAGRVIQGNALLRCLIQLGLGRPSVLFPYDADRNCFTQAIQDERVSGCSLTSSQSFIEEFIAVGNATVEVRAFINRNYALHSSVSAGLVALASAAKVMIEAIESHLVTKTADVQSFLQLQTLFEWPQEVLFLVCKLLRKSDAGKTNEEIVEIVFEEAKNHEYAGPILELLLRILERVSRPWFDALGEATGLQRGSNGLSNLLDDSIVEGEVAQSTNGFPTFVSETDRRLVLETRKCVQFMQDHHPGHPICTFHTRHTVSWDLEWTFTWEDVERITAKADSYRDAVTSAVRAYDSCQMVATSLTDLPLVPASKTGEIVDWAGVDQIEQIDKSVTVLNAIPNFNPHSLPDELYNIITTFLDQTATHRNACNQSHVPLFLMPHLSLHPLLNIQHNLLTILSLRHIILDHDLRTHLDVLHSFFLCASGAFTSRLASVLFSPDFETTERHRGNYRSATGNLGLRLGSEGRRVWPPASSEVRLALRGVLSESWAAPHRRQHQHHRVGLRKPTSTPLFSLPIKNESTRSSEENAFGSTASSNVSHSSLPGNLSFSLRTSLPPNEIDLILDPHTIYALDFLRLSYEPTPALAAIFTPACLEMYDRVFKLLLRVLRVGFVVEQYFRDTLVAGRGRKERTNEGSEKQEEEVLVNRFRYEASRFTNTLTEHFVDTAIGKPWRRFRTYCDGMEKYIRRDELAPGTGLQSAGHDSNARKNTHFSLATLTTTHEATLRTITSSLFLRNRQLKIASLLSVIFSDILQFAKLVRERNGVDSEGVDKKGELKRLLEAFRAHIEEFKDACRKFGEKAEQGAKWKDESAEEEWNIVRALVQKLDGYCVA